MWTTFFDIMDTLESFGCHLIKGIWKRADLYYDFIKKHAQLYDSGQHIDPLEDFRMWLLVIYARVGSHSNLNVRKHVQKVTLKRPFLTPQMKHFFFGEFITMLNSAVMFKELQYYTQFQKNALAVIDFYNRYFENESVDLATDLRMLLTSTVAAASHP